MEGYLIAHRGSECAMEMIGDLVSFRIPHI